jgi:hypothetical protein
MGVEWDSGVIPEPYRSRGGDRVAVFGRWIVDAGPATSTPRSTRR